MAHFLPEVNELLERLDLPCKCGRTTIADGSCFFHAVIDQLSLPGSRQKVSHRASTIPDYLELRREAIRFMATNRELHEIDKFILEKVAIEETRTWESYLEWMSDPGTYVDFFTIWCTAIFLGKDIMLANNSPQASRQQPWTIVPGGYEDTCFESQQPPLTLAYLDDRHFQSLYALPESETRCRGCFWTGQSIRRHLGQPSVKARGCPLFYDVERLQLDAKDRQCEQITAAHRKYAQEKREEKQQYHEKHNQRPPCFSDNKCPICEATFARRLKRDRHIKEVHSAEKIKCTECPKTYTRQEQLDYHIKKVHQAVSTNYKCDICGKDFKYKRNLNRHKDETHAGGHFKCVVCSARFVRKQKLEKHMEKGNHEIEFVCEICEQKLTFRDVASMEKHIKVRNRKQDMVITCTASSTGYYESRLNKDEVREQFIKEGLKMAKDYNDTLAESDKMKKEAVKYPFNREEWMSLNCLLRKVVSLNINSLPLHIEDLKSDPIIKMADVICLQETFCKRRDRVPVLPNFTMHVAGDIPVQWPGVAVFIKDSIMRHVQEVSP